MRRTLTWHFDLPPDRLWPVLAATDRFNEAMGLPPYVLEETPQPDGTVLRRGQGKAAGYTLAWEEKPYEWILNRYFRQSRVFTKGPFRRFGPVFEIVPGGPSQQGELHAGMRADELGRPAVRQPAAAPGGRRRREAHAAGRRLRQGRAPDDVRIAAARAAGRRARARGGARRRDRSQPLRQRARQAADRLRADRHGGRPDASPPQAARARLGRARHAR